MSEALSDYPPEDNIAALQQVFADIPGAVYLRGSYLRREIPYDDLDIIEISEQSHTEAVPGFFRGAKVAYVHLTLSEWETYLRECPRSWYMYYDIAALHQHEDAADTVFAHERNEFFATKEPDHLAYLRYESTMVSNQEHEVPEQDYESLKNMPGSKRSIMRSVFTLKALHPQLRDMTTPDILNHSAAQGIIPATIPDTATRIYETLAKQPIDISELQPLARECMAWMGKLLIATDDALSNTLPAPYLSLLEVAVSSRSEQELTEAQEAAAQLEAPHRKWTASYLLANNSYLPERALEGITSIYHSGYSGRLIRDALHKHGQ